MRLFIALNFDDDFKDGICNAIERLHIAAASGNFTLRENIHLTIEFIGETENIETVKKAMDFVKWGMFVIKTGKTGSFNAGRGKNCWIGIEKNDKLYTIQKDIHNLLLKNGFTLDNRAYKPHITIGREVVFKDGFDIKALTEAVPALMYKVTKVSLMKSERKYGKLSYTEIYSICCTE